MNGTKINIVEDEEEKRKGGELILEHITQTQHSSRICSHLVHSWCLVSSTLQASNT